jgi:predicted dehydrogenase
MGLIDRATNKLSYVQSKHAKRISESKDGSVPINWALMGLGNMAKTCAKALNTTPGARIIAVASRSKDKSEQFAKKYGCPHAYGSYDSMLEDDELHIDIVYIATPVFCHYENIKTALMHGKNVLCEKPIVIKSEELEELRELAKSKSLLLVEGMWMLYLPTFKTANKWISEGKIGCVQGIRVDLSKREAIDYKNSKYSTKEGGGVLLDYGIYPIAFAAYFMNSDISVSYVKAIQHKEGFDKDWTIVLDDDNISATITISSDFDGSRKAVIIGDLGSVVWASQFNRTNTISLYNSEGQMIKTDSYKYIADGLEFEINEIQECLREKKTETHTVPLNVSKRILSIMESLK